MRKRIFSLILTCLLMVSMAIPVSAAKNTKEEKEPIAIETVAQFLDFAEACRLDAYSRDLEVSLEADLDLTDAEFVGIPIFCGTFQGKDRRWLQSRFVPLSYRRGGCAESCGGRNFGACRQPR